MKVEDGKMIWAGSINLFIGDSFHRRNAEEE
jgi:hypothetical protein